MVQESGEITIREVYYDDDGKISWTECEISPSGENLKDFLEDMKLYIKAIKKPILKVRGDKLIEE